MHEKYHVSAANNYYNNCKEWEYIIIKLYSMQHNITF